MPIFVYIINFIRLAYEHNKIKSKGVLGAFSVVGECQVTVPVTRKIGVRLHGGEHPHSELAHLTTDDAVNRLFQEIYVNMTHAHSAFLQTSAAVLTLIHP